MAEWGDLIWAYAGEGEPPKLPQLEFAALPPEQRFVSKKFQQCNWAQAVEGGLDTAHFSYLHANITDGEKSPLLAGDGVNEPPAVVRFRQLMLKSAEVTSAEGRPHGVDAAQAYLVRSGDAMAERGTPLASVLEDRFGEMAGRSLTKT